MKTLVRLPDQDQLTSSYKSVTSLFPRLEKVRDGNIPRRGSLFGSVALCPEELGWLAQDDGTGLLALPSYW
jgi:hypothetical protein